MRTARWLWALGFLAGIVALVVVVLRRTDQFGRVSDWIEELFPDYEAETVDRVAAIGLWGTFGVLALFLLIELMLRARTERSAVARWGMLLVLLVHAAVAVSMMSFVALGAEGKSTELLILAQLALAAVALLVTAIAAAVTRRRQRAQPAEPAPVRRRR